jgi:hypothetical protein
MSTYDVILENVEVVLKSLMSRKSPEDYNNIAKLIEVIQLIRE